MKQNERLENLNRQIFMYQSQGFKVETKNEKLCVATLKRTKHNPAAHFVLFLVIGWLTLGFLNLCLFIYECLTPENITIQG